MKTWKQTQIRFLIWPLLGLALLVNPSADRDENLIGNWRSPKPVGPDDPAEIFEFRFDKKGEVAMFRVQYDFDHESQSWEPAMADQPAQGDDDKWETENGYLTVKIRERYSTNRDLVCKYKIIGDTLQLRMAEIFRPAGEHHEGIFGSWKMETYDQAYPDEKRMRQISIEKPGILKETANTQTFEGRIFPVAGGWKQLAQLRPGEPNSAPDTIFQPLEIIEGNLYLFQQQTWTKMIRRK
jgi:hypothetical protein